MAGTSRFTVGLTGGIGSGKTTVSNLFETLGVAVIDTDIVAREVVAPGQPLLAEIATVFGDPVIANDGSLDRRALRQVIFDHAEARERLNDLMHPAIRRRALAQRDAADSPYCLLVVPLLFETGFDSLVDRVLLVDARETDQIERVSRRDQTDPAQVEQIISSQMSRAEKQQRTDDIIENDGTIAALSEQVNNLHRRYLHLAEKRPKN